MKALESEAPSQGNVGTKTMRPGSADLGSSRRIAEASRRPRSSNRSLAYLAGAYLEALEVPPENSLMSSKDCCN